MSTFEFIIWLLVMIAIHLLYTRSKHYPHTIVGKIIYFLMVFTVTPMFAVPVMWVLVFIADFIATIDLDTDNFMKKNFRKKFF